MTIDTFVLYPHHRTVLKADKDTNKKNTIMQSNYFAAKDPLSLDRIRSVLIRLEDTITFGLIERAQFAHNPRIYTPGAFPELKDLGFEGSWLEWFLKETETFQGECSG